MRDIPQVPFRERLHRIYYLSRTSTDDRMNGVGKGKRVTTRILNLRGGFKPKGPEWLGDVADPRAGGPQTERGVREAALRIRPHHGGVTRAGTGTWQTRPLRKRVGELRFDANSTIPCAIHL